MKIEIIKAHKLLKVGDVLTVNRGYAEQLIKKGIAKEFSKEPEKKSEKK